MNIHCGPGPGYYSYLTGPNPAYINYSRDCALKNDGPDLILLTPSIFGGAAAFILGFGFHDHPLAGGYSKFIFFVDVLAYIATIGTGYYIYQLLDHKKDNGRFKDIILPVLIIVLFYASTYNLVYSLYPDSFEGTIGRNRITQFLSFLAMSVGSISVGETFNITIEDTGTQILMAGETLFNLFVITLIVALVA